MIKKTYKAASLSEAVQLIRREMGPKAAILETKSIPAKKTLFKFTPAQIEVLAGVEERHLTHQQLETLNGTPVPEQIPPKPRADVFSALPSLASKILEERDQKVTQPVIQKMNEDKILIEYRQLRDKVKNLEEENSKLRQQLDSVSGAQDEFKLIQSLMQPQAKNKNETVPEPVEKSAPMAAQITLHPARQETAEFLLEAGISDALLGLWQKRIAKLPVQADASEILDASIEFFLKQFQSPQANLDRLISFIGPEKSGKSTVIMKMAANLKAQGKKVAIFTLDVTDYQAIQDYEKFCSQNDLPFVPIRQNKMYERAIKEYYACDHILIDTYSVSHHDRSAIKRLSTRLENLHTVNFLVFSGCDASSRETIEAYKDFCMDGLIFTHLDKTTHVGHLYNLIAEIEKPVYYYSIGPKTPDDFEIATPERLAALLFNLDEDVRKNNPDPIWVDLDEKGIVS